MKRWLGIASVVLLLIWAPFAYRELSASAPEVEDSADSAFDEGAVEEPADESAQDEEPADPAEPVAEAVAEGAPEDEAPEEPDEAAEPGLEGEQGEAQDPTAPDSPGAAVGLVVSTLSQTFESEPRDALWAADAESRIRGIVEGADLTQGQVLELLELDCRRTICRGVFNLGAEPGETLDGEQGEEPGEQPGEQIEDEPAEEPPAELQLSELFADYRGRMFEHRVAAATPERKAEIYLIRKGYTLDEIKR